MELRRVPPDNRESIIWILFVDPVALAGTSDGECPLALIVGDGTDWRVRVLPPKKGHVNPLDCAIDMHGSGIDVAKLQAENMLRGHGWGSEIDFLTAGVAPAQAHVIDGDTL